MAATILIVEDEYAVARGIQYALQQEGYQVAVARSGEEGLEFALREAPDLVVLDVRLPGIDGFEVLRRLRTSGSKAPVLVLTARDEEMDVNPTKEKKQTNIRSASADEAIRLAVKRIDKAAAKGVIHKNQAANRKAKLMKRAVKAGADA